MSRMESTGVAGAGLDEQARRMLEVKPRAIVLRTTYAETAQTRLVA
jgi:hypothetical protein